MKIMKSLIVIVGVVALASGATYAAWFATQASADNKVTAGTLSFALSANSDGGGSTQGLFSKAGLAPGDFIGERTLYFTNTGSISGKVKLNISYSDWDVSNQGGSNADDFARQLQLTSASTDGYTGMPAIWAGQIVRHVPAYNNTYATALADKAIYMDSANTYAPTMYGLSKIPFYFETDDGNGANPIEWTGNAKHSSTLNFKLSNDAPNRMQGNGINAALTATMLQYNQSGWDI